VLRCQPHERTRRRAADGHHCRDRNGAGSWWHRHSCGFRDLVAGRSRAPCSAACRRHARPELHRFRGCRGPSRSMRALRSISGPCVVHRRGRARAGRAMAARRPGVAVAPTRSELGARAAQPGEFTQACVPERQARSRTGGGRRDLIDSGSAQAARAALRSLQGEFFIAGARPRRSRARTADGGSRRPSIFRRRRSISSATEHSRHGSSSSASDSRTRRDGAAGHVCCATV